MKIASEVYNEVGKASVNAGLGLNLAALIGWLFTKDPLAWWVLPLGIILGFVQVFIGVAFIQTAYRVPKKEDKING